MRLPRKRAQSIKVAVIVTMTWASVSAAQIPIRYGDPRISPDGARIAFMSKRSGRWQIYTMATDGSGLRQLTDGESDNYYPSWSPDGRKIAFCSNRNGNFDIWIMDAEGRPLRNVTDHPATEYEAPVWSPDGERLAFYSDRDHESFEIYVTDVDGSGTTRLTENRKWDRISGQAWSPDGEKLVYFSHWEAEKYEITLMNSDGSRIERLTEFTGHATYPVFSPDGTKILFAVQWDVEDADSGVDVNDALDIAVLDLGDGSIQRLTTSSETETLPSWFPDGRRILFLSGVHLEDRNDFEIFVMNPDGSHREQQIPAAWR